MNPLGTEGTALRGGMAGIEEVMDDEEAPGRGL
jgi:hypothetical protein